MLRFILKRMGGMLASLFVASIVIFAAIELIPGDAASYMLGLNATPEAVAALRAELGLEGVKIERYWRWVSGMLQGDFGISYTYRVAVVDLVLSRLQLSLPLAVLALLVAVAVGVPTGMLAGMLGAMLAADKRGTKTGWGVIEKNLMGLTQIGIAVPNFWFAMILVLIFGVHLQWVSVGGFLGWGHGLGAGLKALLLPAVALAVPQASILARVMRTALLEVMAEDYIRTAKAKGLTPYQVLMRHALRNALIPIVTILGLQFSFLLAGAIIIENVFFLPGLGRLVFQAIIQRDLIVVESVVMLLVFAVILVAFVVDIAYALIDPRLRCSTLYGALSRKAET